MLTNEPAPADLKQRAVRGAAWSAVEAWGARLLTLAVFTILGRLLEPNAFGLVALAVVFVELAKMVVEGGFTRAIIQHGNPTQEHLDTALWISVGTGVVLGAIMAATAGTVATLYGEPGLTRVLQLLALSLPLVAASGVPHSLLQRELRFKSIAARRLIASVVAGVVAVSLAVAGAGVYSLVAQALVNAAVGLVVVWVAVDWRPRFDVSKEHFRSLFAFGVSVIGFNLLSFFQNRGDDFLIGTFLGPVSLGYYFIAFRVLAILAEMLASTIAAVAFPTFARLANDRDRLEEAFLTVTRMTLLLAVPAFIGLAVMADDVIIGVFGERWRPAIPVMRLLAIEGVAIAVGRFNWYLLMAIGRPSWAFRFAALRAATMLGAMLAGLIWGIAGVAAAVTIHAYLFLPVAVWGVRLAVGLDVRRYFRQFLEPLLAGLVMAGAVLVWGTFMSDAGIVLRLVTSGFVGLGSYVLALRLLAPRLITEAIDYARLLRPEQRRATAVAPSE